MIADEEKSILIENSDYQSYLGTDNKTDRNLGVSANSQKLAYINYSGYCDKVKTAFITGVSSIRYFIFVPALIDGVAYGVLSLSETATTVENFAKFPKDFLKKPHIILPLSIVPLFAGISLAGLNSHENWKKFIREKEPKNVNSEREKHKKSIKEIFWNHPGVFMVVGIAAVVDGIIFTTNMSYLLNQLGIEFETKLAFFSTLETAVFVIMQYLLLYTPALLKMAYKGFTIESYTSPDELWIWRNFKKFIVNVPPIITAIVMGMLGTVESYSLMQYVISRFEPEDISNRAAWVPAMILGALYGVCHLGVYGRDFKEFIASYCFRSLSKIEIQEPDQENYINIEAVDSSENVHEKNQETSVVINAYWKKTKCISQIILGTGVGVSSAIIAFGAMDDMIYTFIFSEAPTEPVITDPNYAAYRHMFPVYLKALIFALPIIIVGLETYAVEIHNLLETNNKNNKENNSIAMIQGTTGTYNLSKFLSDAIIFSIVAGVKYSLDWYFIPSSVPPNEITLTQISISASILGLLTSGQRLLLEHFFGNSSQINFSYEEARLLDKHLRNDVFSDTEIQQFETVKDKVKEFNNIHQNSDSNESMQQPPSMLRKAIKLGIITVLVTGTTMGVQLLARHVLFTPTENEEENRLDTAQVMAAAVAGITAVVAERTYGCLEKRIYRGVEKSVKWFTNVGKCCFFLNTHHSKVEEITPANQKRYDANAESEDMNMEKNKEVFKFHTA